MYAEVLLLYDKVTVRMREAQLKYRARADLLTEGGCRGILPLNILRRGSDITGYYSVSGYTRVSKLKDLSAEKALTVAEATLNAIEECCRCFIFPEEFIINAETAYISENFERVRFTYIPDNEQISGRIKFADLMRQMSANNCLLYTSEKKDLAAAVYLKGQQRSMASQTGNGAQQPC